MAGSIGAGGGETVGRALRVAFSAPFTSCSISAQTGEQVASVFKRCITGIIDYSTAFAVVSYAFAQQPFIVAVLRHMYIPLPWPLWLGGIALPALHSCAPRSERA